MHRFWGKFLRDISNLGTCLGINGRNTEKNKEGERGTRMNLGESLTLGSREPQKKNPLKIQKNINKIVKRTNSVVKAQKNKRKV